MEMKLVVWWGSGVVFLEYKVTWASFAVNKATS